jgi:integrase
MVIAYLLNGYCLVAVKCLRMKKTVKFDLFPQKSDSKPVRMRVSYCGQRVDIRIGYSIETEKWDAKAMRVVSGAKNKFKQSGNEINKAILNSETQIDEIFIRYELLEKRVPTAHELKKAFYELNGKKLSETESTKSFYDVFDEFTETVGEHNEWSDATYHKFETIKNHLQNFDGNLKFEDLNDEKLYSFISYLHDVANLRNTTIAKYISYVKWFLRWAASKNYYAGKIQFFNPKLKGTDGNSKVVIHLTWDELMTLFNFEFSEDKPSLSPVRDVFCFLCFTGLRHSDVYKLKRSDVKEDHILVVTKKTADGIKIELNKYSKAILDKYKDVKFENSKALPVISQQRMNDHLKTIGKIAGINDSQRIVYFKKKERIEEVYPKYALLTTHCGRRTFVVNALTLGIPSEVIMKWTGHSDYKAMKPYIKIVDAIKEKSMKKFDDV